MPLDATSWFQVEAEKSTVSPKRIFMIGNSDYSQYVTKWPSFGLQWDDVRPKGLKMNLANEDQSLNFFIQDRIKFVTSGAVQVALTHPTSGDEVITLFQGMIDIINYANKGCDISLTDKYNILANRVVGTQNTPADYTASNYYPAQIAWDLCTSYGGLSAVESTSNPDIDYASYTDWLNVFSGDSVLFQGYFTGQKSTELLKKIARMTRSAITRRNDKIYFKRFSLVDSLNTVYDDVTKWGVQLNLDDSNIINKELVFFDYSVTSGYHQGTVDLQNSASVNSYGIHENDEQDKQVWYVNSSSAANLAQRVLLTNSSLFEKVKITTGFKGMLNVIGDMLQFTDSHLQLTSQTYRIMGATYNLNDFSCEFDVDASQVNNAFVLDSSSLDGSDVLS